MRVASFGRPAGDDGRKVERCFADSTYRAACATRGHRRARGREASPPARDRASRPRRCSGVTPSHITRTDERRVGFHQGDGLRGAALGDGLPQRIDRRAGGRPLGAESHAAILFLALDGGDNLAVLAVDGNGIRRGRVAVRPDAHARVRAELHQDAGQLLIATQHGAMERAVAELGVIGLIRSGRALASRRTAATSPASTAARSAAKFTPST